MVHGIHLEIHDQIPDNFSRVTAAFSYPTDYEMSTMQQDPPEDKNLNGLHRLKLMTSTNNPLFGSNLISYSKYALKLQIDLNSGIFLFHQLEKNRPEWGVFDHLFSYNKYTSVESGITYNNARKTCLLIPVLEVKILFIIEECKGNGKRGKTGVLGYRFENQKGSIPGIFAAS